jgi:hypothetical protein
MSLTSDAGLVIAEMENRRGDGQRQMSMLEIGPRLAQYKMPPISVGATVLWYRHGTRSSRPALGFVARYEKDSQNIDIAVPTEGADIIESVPHLSDPRLELGYEHSSSGAWDYTESHRDAVMTRHEIEDRLAKLESEVNSIAGKARKTTT